MQRRETCDFLEPLLLLARAHVHSQVGCLDEACALYLRLFAIVKCGGPREQNDECTFDPTWATAVELGNGCASAKRSMTSSKPTKKARSRLFDKLKVGTWVLIGLHNMSAAPVQQPRKSLGGTVALCRQENGSTSHRAKKGVLTKMTRED